MNEAVLKTCVHHDPSQLQGIFPHETTRIEPCSLGLFILPHPSGGTAYMMRLVLDRLGNPHACTQYQLCQTLDSCFS